MDYLVRRLVRAQGSRRGKGRAVVKIPCHMHIETQDPPQATPHPTNPVQAPRPHTWFARRPSPIRKLSGLMSRWMNDLLCRNSMRESWEGGDGHGKLSSGSSGESTPTPTRGRRGGDHAGSHTSDTTLDDAEASHTLPARRKPPCLPSDPRASGPS